MLGETEGLAQKDISTQGPGGGGKSQRRGGLVSWAGHSPKKKPPLQSFLRHQWIFNHFFLSGSACYCTPTTHRGFSYITSLSKRSSRSQDRLTWHLGPDLLTVGLLSTQPPQGTLMPTRVRVKGAWGWGARNTAMSPRVRDMYMSACSLLHS